MTDGIRWIEDEAELARHYGTPAEAATIKVQRRITPLLARWIEASRFCVLTTAGPEGTDGSPRGDDGPVVRIEGDRTILMPDWRGNERIDSLRNVVRDGRTSLMFFVPGSNNVVRVNGRARLTADPRVTESFAQGGRHPRSVIVVGVEEAYSQCARALLRARLWTAGDESAALPTVGDLLAEAKAGFDGATYDAEWPVRAAQTMW